MCWPYKKFRRQVTKRRMLMAQAPSQYATNFCIKVKYFEIMKNNNNSLSCKLDSFQRSLNSRMMKIATNLLTCILTKFHAGFRVFKCVCDWVSKLTAFLGSTEYFTLCQMQKVFSLYCLIYLNIAILPIFSESLFNNIVTAFLFTIVHRTIAYANLNDVVEFIIYIILLLWRFFSCSLFLSVHWTRRFDDWHLLLLL